jgi:hypothetical protein
MSEFSTLKALMETQFTSKVKLDPAVGSQGVKTIDGQTKQYADMNLSEKLVQLNHKYQVGKRLLAHVNRQKEMKHVNKQTGEVTTHFDQKENMKNRMRVLEGFKQLKKMMAEIFAQLEEEERQLAREVGQNGPN